MKNAIIASFLGLLALAAGSALAQKTERIRGAITAFEGSVLSVKTRDGRDIRIELTEKASVDTARATTLADLKTGTYVGVTTRKRDDGALVAVEVHTLPPTVKPGYVAWDLAPGTMMTNANIESVAQVTGGQELAVQYQGGAQKILVPPGTPIITTVAADRSFLKPGEYVFMSVQVAEDGRMSTSGRIQVSRDGVKPEH